MRLLLFGPGGQLGSALTQTLAPLGELHALSRAGSPAGSGDLADPGGVAATVRALRPEVVVNAAAYTAVDRAESDATLVQLVNADAPGAMARACAETGALFVHYSSDYVFDGSGTRPWRETDTPAPLSVYGLSKLAGEQAVRASGCQHLILRTSWVHGQRGGNFVRTMLRLGGEREQLSVVADQIGAPTSAEWLAEVTAALILATLAAPRHAGTYHCAASGETSWHGYAQFVFQQARLAGWPLRLRELRPIASADYPTPARRPLNSRLDTRKLGVAFGLAPPPWQDGVGALVRHLGANPDKS